MLVNADILARCLIAQGYPIVSGGTRNHLMLVNLIGKSITGKDADALLGRANITVNKNTVPNDPLSPFVTSGLRLGTPAITTRGFKETEVKQIASWIVSLLDDPANEALVTKVQSEVKQLCHAFPVYG